MSRFFVLVKPDAVQTNAACRVLAAFELEGFKLVQLRVETPSRECAEAHYAEHAGKAFCAGLISFTISGPAVAAEFRGDVARARALVGATDPAQAAPGTIRARFGRGVPDNAVHCSADAESAARELELWFPTGERVYTVTSEQPYGLGLRGAFGSLRAAEEYALTHGAAANLDYVIASQVLGEPESLQEVANSSGRF